MSLWVNGEGLRSCLTFSRREDSAHVASTLDHSTDQQRDFQPSVSGTQWFNKVIALLIQIRAK